MLITLCLGIGGTVARVKRRRNRSIAVCLLGCFSSLAFVRLRHMSVLYLARHSDIYFKMGRMAWPFFFDLHDWSFGSTISLSIMYGTGFVGLV